MQRYIAEMTFSSRPRPNTPALLAIVVLHAALASLLLAQRERVAHGPEGAAREAIQWLLPLPAPLARGLSAPPVAQASASDQRRAVRPAVPQEQRPMPRASTAARTETVATSVAPMADAPAAIAPAAAPVAAPAAAPDPFNGVTTPAADTLLGRHDWGAGKADHALRGGKLSTLVRPTNTLQAGLERAFQEAGEAVPPKWFSAPEIREMSVPEGRMRMYKIRTAMGTYCFYKPDPSLQASYDYKLMTCPREK